MRLLLAHTEHDSAQQFVLLGEFFRVVGGSSAGGLELRKLGGGGFHLLLGGVHRVEIFLALLAGCGELLGGIAEVLLQACDFRVLGRRAGVQIGDGFLRVGELLRKRGVVGHELVDLLLAFLRFLERIHGVVALLDRGVALLPGIRHPFLFLLGGILRDKEFGVLLLEFVLEARDLVFQLLHSRGILGLVGHRGFVGVLGLLDLRLELGNIDAGLITLLDYAVKLLFQLLIFMFLCGVTGLHFRKLLLHLLVLGLQIPEGVSGAGGGSRACIHLGGWSWGGLGVIGVLRQRRLDLHGARPINGYFLLELGNCIRRFVQAVGNDHRLPVGEFCVDLLVKGGRVFVGLQSEFEFAVVLEFLGLLEGHVGVQKEVGGIAGIGAHMGCRSDIKREKKYQD